MFGLLSFWFKKVTNLFSKAGEINMINKVCKVWIKFNWHLFVNSSVIILIVWPWFFNSMNEAKIVLRTDYLRQTAKKSSYPVKYCNEVKCGCKIASPLLPEHSLILVILMHLPKVHQDSSQSWRRSCWWIFEVLRLVCFCHLGGSEIFRRCTLVQMQMA